MFPVYTNINLHDTEAWTEGITLDFRRNLIKR